MIDTLAGWHVTLILVVITICAALLAAIEDSPSDRPDDLDPPSHWSAT
jgi:hypothetical protein